MSSLTDPTIPSRDTNGSNGKGSNEWPDPLTLQDELPPVEPFDYNLLPRSFRDLVKDSAERMQVPPDFPATVAVLSLAGVVNRRASIQPKAQDSEWRVTPNLWGGIIAPPGYMKSPVIQTMTRPLVKTQDLWRKEYERAMAIYEEQKVEKGLAEAAWKTLETTQWKKKLQGKDANGGGSDTSRSQIKKPVDSLRAPTARRLIVNDATFESLHTIMGENPDGILLVRDELAGFLVMLDRHGREGERQFHLEAWNGDSGFTVDRVGRGTIHVPACCESILGGIQPARLRQYLVEALRDGFANDGLIQRFQLMVWPDAPAKWQLVDRPPDGDAQVKVARVFEKLVELKYEDPLFGPMPLQGRFAPGAQLLFNQWLGELEVKVRSDEPHPALAAHLSKYRSLMPTLALLFELADRVAHPAFAGFNDVELGTSPKIEVSVEHTAQAIAWCRYLESHARRIYSCLTTPQMRAARDLAEKIKRKKVKVYSHKPSQTDANNDHVCFAARDVYLNGWSGLDTPEAVRAATEVLEDACWLRHESVIDTGGRPATRYKVNPKVWR